jgi:hypothetical protein
MRPITTHFYVLLAGSGHYLGKAPYYSQESGTASTSSSSSSSTAPVDLHAAFLEDPAAWATQLPPVLLPEACREMVYKFQVRRLHQGRRGVGQGSE